MPSIFASLSLAVVAITVAAQTDDSELLAKLITANSQANRIKALLDDSDFVFDFNKARPGVSKGGFVSAADQTNFPALAVGNGAMVVGVLGPCGCNSPHIHPRGTEINLLISGVGPIQDQMMQENGARVVTTSRVTGQAIVLPMGSLHFQQNMGCEPVVFVASFDVSDPGTLSAANALSALDHNVVSPAFGIDVKVLDHLMLPTNFILGAQECLDRCRIDRNTFNFNSTFKDFHAFSQSTSNNTYTPPSGSAAQGSASTTGATLNSTNVTGTHNVAAFLADADGNAAIPFGQNPLRHAVIGLSVTAAALLLALLSMTAMTAYRRRSGVKVSPRFGSSFTPSTGKGYPYVTPYDDAQVFASRHSMDKA